MHNDRRARPSATGRSRPHEACHRHALPCVRSAVPEQAKVRVSCAEQRPPAPTVPALDARPGRLPPAATRRSPTSTAFCGPHRPARVGGLRLWWQGTAARPGSGRGARCRPPESRDWLSVALGAPDAPGPGGHAACAPRIRCGTTRVAAAPGSPAWRNPAAHAAASAPAH